MQKLYIHFHVIIFRAICWGVYCETFKQQAAWRDCTGIDCTGSITHGTWWTKKVRIFLGNMTQRMWFFSGKKQVGYKEKCGNFLVFTNIHSCLLLFGIPATIQCLLSTRRIPLPNILVIFIVRLMNKSHLLLWQKLHPSTNTQRQCPCDKHVPVLSTVDVPWTHFVELSQSHVMSPRVLWP